MSGDGHAGVRASHFGGKVKVPSNASEVARVLRLLREEVRPTQLTGRYVFKPPRVSTDGTLLLGTLTVEVVLNDSETATWKDTGIGKPTPRLRAVVKVRHHQGDIRQMCHDMTAQLHQLTRHHTMLTIPLDRPEEWSTALQPLPDGLQVGGNSIPAALRPYVGQVITEVNGTPVLTPEDFVSLAQERPQATLRIEPRIVLGVAVQSVGGYLNITAHLRGSGEYLLVGTAHSALTPIFLGFSTRTPHFSQVQRVLEGCEAHLLHPPSRHHHCAVCPQLRSPPRRPVHPVSPKSPDRSGASSLTLIEMHPLCFSPIEGDDEGSEDGGEGTSLLVQVAVGGTVDDVLPTLGRVRHLVAAAREFVVQGVPQVSIDNATVARIFEARVSQRRNELEETGRTLQPSVSILLDGVASSPRQAKLTPTGRSIWKSKLDDLLSQPLDDHPSGISSPIPAVPKDRGQPCVVVEVKVDTHAKPSDVAASVSNLALRVAHIGGYPLKHCLVRTNPGVSMRLRHAMEGTAKAKVKVPTDTGVSQRLELTKDEVMKVVKIFEEIDADKSGSITWNEILSFAAHNPGVISKNIINTVVAEESSKVQLPDLAQYFFPSYPQHLVQQAVARWTAPSTRESEKPPPDLLRAVESIYQAFDKEGRGYIMLDDLARELLSTDLTTTDLQKIFEHWDPPKAVRTQTSTPSAVTSTLSPPSNKITRSDFVQILSEVFLLERREHSADSKNAGSKWLSLFPGGSVERLLHPE